MKSAYSSKSSVEEIRARFDQDVERFSVLSTGQQTTMDAAYCLETVTEAVARLTPKAKSLLDLGCGAGNYTLKMLEKIPGLDCTLIDLSHPMLERAKQRVSAATIGKVEVIQSDIRDIDLPENAFCIAVAGATLHHLRDDDEWELVFTKIYRSLKKGASFWICDLITHDLPQIQELFEQIYGDYLTDIGGKEFQQKVFDYIEKEDTPRSLGFQMDLLKKVGFSHVEVLHKNACFAAFGGIR
ncbi:class I SAM-dependent methyltransferase [Pedobacter sp. PWIIR3]